MAKSIKTAYAYCAGLIDGEGCISIGKKPKYHQNNKGTNQFTRIPANNTIEPYYDLHVIVVTKDVHLTKYLHGIFGGSINDVNRNKGFCQGTFKRWVVGANMAKEALQKMYPYLILKKEQARTAIEFQIENKKYWKTNKGKKTSDENLVKREKYYLRLRELKKCAGAETNSSDANKRSDSPTLRAIGD